MAAERSAATGNFCKIRTCDPCSDQVGADSAHDYAELAEGPHDLNLEGATSAVTAEQRSAPHNARLGANKLCESEATCLESESCRPIFETSTTKACFGVK